MTAGLWVVHCSDAPGSADARAALRPAHSAWWREGPLPASLYGMLSDPSDGTAAGSLFVVAAEDAAQVRAHLDGDPFWTGGVWSRVRVDAFTPSRHSPVSLL
ncbi:YciI family protein [Streptomyces sp. NPDC060184]|uniref:YciI family protein n=1 Tax=Streptomyces sp. NPDC060184 TaxID=3347064 RepID=UPI003666B704